MADNKTDSIIKYVNDMLARQEERIVVLTGRTEYARFSFELTGVDFVRSRKIEGSTIDEIVDSCVKEILVVGLAEDIKYSPSPLPDPEGDTEFKVTGCIHLPKEKKLAEDKVTPYICPIGNILSTVILENAGYEMGSIRNSEIHHNRNECILKGTLCRNAITALNQGGFPPARKPARLRRFLAGRLTTCFGRP